MQDIITTVKEQIRAAIRVFARVLNTATQGRLSPDWVTIFGALMHVPIAVLIARGHLVLAGVLLVIFGLFDTLDGELARLQKRASNRGMLLDASTDRMKEVAVYTGVAYFLASGTHPKFAVWAVVACGASLCVSYIKAKGEAAVASGAQTIPHATLNRMFADGLWTFEIRMFLLAVGLLTSFLTWAIIIVAIGASFTALQRLVRISGKL